jgi:predicted transcriptional regulator
MKWVIAWIEEYEGVKEPLQVTEAFVAEAIAQVVALMANDNVSQITVMIEDSNGRMEA